MTAGQPSAAMARIATNVAVLSTGTPAAAYGITANVWGEPANRGYLLVTLRREGRFLPALLRERAFVANVLGAGQQEVALRFARHADGPGPGMRPAEVLPTAAGTPRLRWSHAWFSCTVAETMRFGSYDVVTARIGESGLGDEASPLLYHDGAFGLLAGR